jgi:hypothetical protein
MIRRELLRALLPTTIAVALFVVCDARSVPLSNVYTDPQYRFRLTAPEGGWSISDKTGISDVLVAIMSDEAVDDFFPNVTVTIEPVPAMMTAEEYGKRNLELLSELGYTRLIAGTSIINAIRVYEFACVGGNTPVPAYLRHLCLVKDRIGFIITCAVPENHRERFEGDFDAIVHSFRFL